ncbi:hypothetical protein CPB83DRAFT_890061 [Crepidotus variabilis]|uniref:G domain-containing protein n=1 Tax=Crepidotus variabilis TaxID=179855 RepID=A0A9P6ER86_9AGAR|nr:hypothetical protein CPB83DRAFT_890061 [Crepidotus variabilis]
MASTSNTFVPHPDDKIIAVIGLPGSGKSTIIDHITGLTNSSPRANSTLGATNHGVDPIRHSHPFLPGKCLVILEVGCPEDDDDLVESLDKAEEWISSNYNKTVRLSGILYVHSIQQNRVPPIKEELRRRLEPFSKSKGVVIVTTFWFKKSKADSTKAPAREAQLEGEYWYPLIRNGASHLKFEIEFSSCAAKILRHLLTQRSNGTHLKNVFEKVGTTFVKSSAGRRISIQIEQILLQEQENMKRVSGFLDKTPSSPVPPPISDEIQQLERRIHELHEKISKLRTSFARRLFARMFG